MSGGRAGVQVESDGAFSRTTPVHPAPRTVTVIGLILLGLAAAGCASRTPCDRVIGAHVCSMVPEPYTCDCDGTIEPANDEDNRYAACGRVTTVCVGSVISSRRAEKTFPYWDWPGELTDPRARPGALEK